MALKTILNIKSLSKKYGDTEVLSNVNMKVEEGEFIAVMGQSGCGKSTLLYNISGMDKIDSGNVLFNGKDISGKMSPQDKRMLRTKMQMIFQDPMACLNPRKKVVDIIGEGLRVHNVCKSEEEIVQRVYDILKLVGLSKEQAERYPHQFSGGQRQRIGIARALIMNPDLIIADEAISALDVSIQAQIVNLMKKIQKNTGISYLFIAHDLSMVKYISDNVGVIHLGHLVESGTTDEIFNNPIHPYTRSLLSAIPVPDPVLEQNKILKEYDASMLKTSYSDSKVINIEGSHYVLGTEEDIQEWKNEIK